MHKTELVSDAPWFNVDERYVVHKTETDEALKNFEDACNEDTPLKFRPFMAKAVGKLRRSLAVCLRRVVLLTNVDSNARHPKFFLWNRGVVFPVKPRRLIGPTSRPSYSCCFVACN